MYAQLLKKKIKNISRIVEYIFCKLPRELTRSLEGTKEPKGLITYTKSNYDSYSSELGLQASSSFVLREDEQKINMGIFVRY